MKVFVKEYRRDVTVRIYGVDGEEHTREFFAKYFSGIKGVYETTADERSEYSSQAEYTIEKAEHYELLAQQLEAIQNGIDELAEALIRGENVNDYVFDECCYII